MERTLNSEAGSREISLDGVHYSLLNHMGAEWRLASDNPLWREELAGLPPRPEPAALEALREKRVWLAPVGGRASIALACCGLGAAWPGMGKALYASFPVARKAMEELASLAEWDVLSLLNETDQSVINSLRWQIPYLFLLEYAQWRQLESLGFKPDIVCGHSIGELVALCAAGVYDARSAWYLFDTRAAHIAGLEARSGRETGMLAAATDGEVIDEILADWPSVKVANANTRGQYVLGGPRADLLQIRKSLRRARVVAFMLPMGMAFHNPAMAILRALAYRRLMALDMRPPAIPIVSCVDGARYPADKEEICRAITRLDENKVDWIGCVDTVDRRWNIRQWVELGPQEILCGLIKENAPDSECLAADRKDREALSMRELCCQLFANGHFSWESILKEKNSRQEAGAPVEFSEKSPDIPELPLLDEDGKKVLEALSEASGRALNEGDLHLDLRRDLALRSSSFPHLVQEAENRLGRTVALENIPQISSVGDLVKFLTGKTPDETRPAPSPAAPPRIAKINLERLAPENGVLKAAPLNPAKEGIRLSKDSLVCVIAPEPEKYPDLWAALGAAGCAIAAPWIQTETCARLAGGGEILALDCDPDCSFDELANALAKIVGKSGPFDAIFILPPALATPPDSGERDESKLADCENFLKENGELVLMRRIDAADESISLDEATSAGGKTRIIDWIVADSDAGARFDAGDIPLLEIFYGSGGRAIWRAPSGEPSSRFLPCSRIYADIFPAMGIAGGQWERQFSLFASPELASRGGGEFNPFSDPLFPDSPWLSMGAAAADLLLAARLSNPWLIPFGLSDARVSRLPSFPRAATRICRFRCENRVWLPQDGRLSRLCHVWASVEGVSKNGRATGEWEAASEGLALLATGADWPAPLWNTEDFEGAGETVAIDLDHLYNILNFGREWRFLSSLALVEGKGDKNSRYVAELNIPAAVAGERNWRYKKIGYLIEAVFQATVGVFTQSSLDSSPILAFGRGLAATIGFIRFNFLELSPSGSPRLQLELSWREKNLVRFDAQLIDDHNRATLTVNHLEFDMKSGDSGGEKPRSAPSANFDSGEK